MAAQAILVRHAVCDRRRPRLDLIVQPKALGKGVVVEKKLMKEWPALWMPMIDTADLVAKNTASRARHRTRTRCARSSGRRRRRRRASSTPKSSRWRR